MRLLSFTLRMPKYSVFYQLLEGEGLLSCIYFFISNFRFGHTSRLYSSAIIYELAVGRLLDIDKISINRQNKAKQIIPNNEHKKSVNVINSQCHLQRHQNILIADRLKIDNKEIAVSYRRCGRNLRAKLDTAIPVVKVVL